MSFRAGVLPKDGDAEQPALKLAIRCFGAQAVMCGLLLCISRMDRRAHAIWAAAILPFFLFDAAAYRSRMITGLGALGDAAGNVVFLACSAVGAGWL